MVLTCSNINEVDVAVEIAKIFKTRNWGNLHIRDIENRIRIIIQVEPTGVSCLRKKWHNYFSSDVPSMTSVFCIPRDFLRAPVSFHFHHLQLH